MRDSRPARTTVRLAKQDHDALLVIAAESMRSVKGLIAFAARDTLDAMLADESVAEELMHWCNAPHRRPTEPVNLTRSADGSYDILLTVLNVISENARRVTGSTVGESTIARAVVGRWLATYTMEEALERVGVPYPRAWREKTLPKAS